MCGLAGFIDRGSTLSAPAFSAIAHRMAASLHHRGPDDRGIWVDTDARIALSHTRLAVVDLSAAGAQPMASADGRFMIVYNGEIYNHTELRAELAATGSRFRGHSDTEVILEACATWGFERTVARLIGMFAFALWDRRDRSLMLARDQIGIKPLYWAQTDEVFLFGSELKALRAHPRWTPRVDRNALAAYMRYGYIPSPLTIYDNVWKLAPGAMLVLEPGVEPRISRYWDLQSFAAAEVRKKPRLADSQAADELEKLLLDSVKRQMVADVPIGAFLSGGIDSSTVVALMQAQSSRPIRTFSIGFTTPEFDEAKRASAIARHLGTEHTEMYVTPSEALGLVPGLAEWYDEPNADSSQIPTYLVSALTREHVTVALTGDGGDELFGGYDRYLRVQRLWSLLSRLPRRSRWALTASAERLLTFRFPDPLGQFLEAAQSRPAISRAKHRLNRLVEIGTAEEPDEINRSLITLWDQCEAVVPGSVEPSFAFSDPSLIAQFGDISDRMQLADTLVYLPDDILSKVDRASMAVSLEVRVPLLDHRVVEFAWQLPRHFRVRRRKGKRALRDVLYRYVPRRLVDRPKKGFSVPIDTWLRGPLRDWAESLLSEHELRSGAELAPGPIRARWAEHLAGERNWGGALWAVLMFQAWKARWLSTSGDASEGDASAAAAQRFA